MSGANAVQKQSLADVLQNWCQDCNFIKKRLQHRCFSMKFTKSLRTLFYQNTSTLMATSGSKQCKPMETYAESLSCPKRKWYNWMVLLRLVFLDNEYSSKVFQTLLAVPHFGNVAWKSQKQSSRGVLQKRCFWKFRKPKVFPCEFWEIFKNNFFHKTPPVAVSEKLKAEAVVWKCSVKRCS